MSPSQSRKHRGYDTQRMVARAWAADGWPYALPVGAGAPGADITGTPDLAIEVKARTGFDPMAALRQAKTRPGVPIVILRPNGYGETTIDDWPAIVPHGVLRRLLREAGYGDPIEGGRAA